MFKEALPFLLTLFSLGIYILYLLISDQQFARKRDQILYRVHVNGIRGKSTVTRYVAAVLREAGYKTFGKITDLTNSNFVGAILKGVNLQGANLQGADFQKANLQGANLQRTNLNLTNFKRANLSDTYLGGAILEETNLENAFLERTCLGSQECTFKTVSVTSFPRKTTIISVNFKGTNLKGASFKGIEGENIPWETMQLCNTILPNGIVSDRDCANP